MRLERILLQGFRGISDRVEIPLDSDAIVVVGDNGRGKTTLFDGILWVLTGAVPRVEGGDKALLSLYSKSGEMRVELALVDELAGKVTVSRRYDGHSTTLQVAVDGETLNDDIAEARLARLLSTDAEGRDQAKLLMSAMTRSVYLQQDLVKEFVVASDRRERFQAIADLLGNGRVADLQAALERAKQNWAGATTRLRRDFQPEVDRYNALRRDLESVVVGNQYTESEMLARWLQLLESSRAAGLKIAQGDMPTRAEIESLLGQTQVLRQTTAQRSQQLTEANELREKYEETSSRARQDEGLTVTQLTEAQLGLQRATEHVRVAQSAVDSARTKVESAENENERMRIFAGLALELLADHCPVCAQTYDRQATEARLSALTASQPSFVDTLESAQTALASARAEEQLAANVLEIALAADKARRDLERETREARSELERALVGLGMQGFDPDLTGMQLEQLTQETRTRLVALGNVLEAAEAMSLHFSTLNASRRRSQAESEIRAVETLVQQNQSIFDRRDAAYEIASDMIPGLRSAADSLVAGQILTLEPVLQQIYSSIDPHPSFKLVSLVQQRKGRNAELSTLISDPDSRVQSESPKDVLSSSQSNALAVALFLSLNLTAARLPLDAVILDDPMQSMDPVHLLGLVDVLRRVLPSRQLLVSTHDKNLGSLLARKLRPAGQISSTIVIRIGAWSPESTTYECERLPVDDSPMRIAS